MITNEWIPGKNNYDVVLNIRKMVFGESKHDAFDEYAMHLVVYNSDIPVASGRLFLGHGNVFCIDNVCVLEEYRQAGIGDLTAKLLLYRGFEYTDKIYADIPDEYVSFFVRYGFKNSDGKYAVKKNEVVYPSKCGRKQSSL